MKTVDPILRVHDLWVRYGDVVAVAGADLEIIRPGILALLGPSGCGKTSLLRAIAGFETPERGTVELDGEVVVGPGRWVEAEKRRLGMVFQQGALFPHLTVWRNVLYGVSSRPDGARRAQEVLELVGLKELRDRYPDELSGGQQQRVALARALAPAPRLVLLDEPFANLDASLRTRVRDQVRAILETSGTTAILVTHDQEEALSAADRVAVMQHGEILQVGSPEEVYHHPATVEVAHFVGDGQLVDCSVRSGLVRCPYGSAVSDAPDGEGRLFVRPEDLQVLPRSHDEGVDGEIVQRRFFGHDLIAEVMTVGGDAVQIRQLSSDSSAPGTPVKVCLRKKAFRVFPASL